MNRVQLLVPVHSLVYLHPQTCASVKRLAAFRGTLIAKPNNRCMRAGEEKPTVIIKALKHNGSSPNLKALAAAPEAPRPQSLEAPSHQRSSFGAGKAGKGRMSSMHTVRE